MSGAVVQCPTCGKTITPEEIEIGASLVCPVCDPDRAHREAEERPAEDKDQDGN